MKLIELIKFERPLYLHYWYPDYTYAIRCILRLAKQQGVLPEICSRLGISLRSTQRWIPTPLIQTKIPKVQVQPTPKGNYLSLFPDKAMPVEYKKRKRVNRKKKAFNLNKSIERLLHLVFINDEPIPEKEPTDKEVMKLLL